MHSLSRFLRRLRLFVRRENFNREMEEEMAFHKEETEKEFRADGMDACDARHAANCQFGNETRLRDESRETVAFWFESFLTDCRYAMRQFMKASGFTLTIVVTLALGIGATTAIFTLVYATLLRSLPYPQADRVVHIEDARLQGQSTAGLVGMGRFFDIRARSKSFASLGFFYFDHTTLIAGNHLPVAMKAIGASAGFWNILGVQPMLGRTFNEQDDMPNAPGAVVLSYGTWQQIFDGDPGVIGKQVTLDQKAATVVGVMPQGFNMPNGIDLWQPAQRDAADLWSKNRGENTRFINVYGRLKPGVSLQAAQNDLHTIGEQLRREYPATDAGWQFSSESLRDDLYGELRPALVVLLIASGFLLLIACVNVANLLLSRATSREREVALRRALGASEARIRLQFLIESTMLALFGGCAGLAATFALVRTVAAKLPGRLGAPGTIAMNWPVVWFAVVLAVGVGIVFGITPAIRNRQIDLNTSLKRGEARLSVPTGAGVRGAFISVQVGLSVVLLIGASLLAESFWNLLKSPLGFQPDHLLTFSIDLPWNTDEARVRNFYAEIQRRIAALPGAQSVGQISTLPIVDWHLRGNFDADWLPRSPKRDTVNVEERSFAWDYLAAMGTPLLAGRTFTEQDATADLAPVIVNQQFVRQYFPGGNPSGRHLISDNSYIGTVEIVGVIGNVRGTAGSIASKAGPEVYFPLDGHSVMRSFVVRSHVPPEQMMNAIREQVHQVDPRQAIANVRSMDDLLDKAVAQPRLNMAIVVSFAVVALLLACVGIYGVVAYAVAQRTQEIGVRMALGATRGQISRHFIRRALTSAMFGLFAGTVCALLLTRLLRSQLYGVTPDDPVIYLGSIALLLVPVVLATLRPALIAASVDPVEALRAE
ncbi:ABC transporter permease [Alloacidobacterium sp.]|uniref:ABC transporter permease n=1 Tax=Alloacidobacterium sp. TaxID=2951999 RepID=UPI002D330728|nr:ABC transporter permease [Alloacidobacterium sp.]HYK34586.1 ABC transporter permease [Alloacidobacterium sp.]